MITRAYVVSKEQSDHTFKVLIPIFHSINTPITDLPSASLCTLPNVNNSINIGDRVFIDFEENDYDKPVILGMLYTGKDWSKTNSNIDINIRTLDVAPIEYKKLTIQGRRSSNDNTIYDVTIVDEEDAVNTNTSDSTSANLPYNTVIRTNSDEINTQTLLNSIDATNYYFGLDSIELDTANVKTAYSFGDTFSAVGLIVTAYYGNPDVVTQRTAEIALSACTIDAPTIPSEGTTQIEAVVTVTYNGCSNTYTITIG